MSRLTPPSQHARNTMNTQIIPRVIATLALVLLSGCASPLGTLGRAFPDGSSGAIDEINAQFSMTGSGSMVLKGIRWSGTNGFPLPADGTNAVTSTSVTTRVRR